MSGFDTGNYVPRPVYKVAGGYSNTPTQRGTPVFRVPGTNSLSNVQNPVFGNITGGFTSQTSAGAPAPTDLRPFITGAGKGPMGADARDGWDGMRADAPLPTQEDDEYLNLLYGLMQQAGQGSGGRSVDLSGFDDALQNLEDEKTRVSDRYKKYSGQIADIYGTLTGINKSMIENIEPRGDANRAALSAQEAERAEATRATENARLEAATRARQELGLQDLAGEYAGGDIVTDQSEGMVTDAEAQRVAAENTLLANEAIAQQQGSNQNIAYGLQQEESDKKLNASLEDVMAAIRAQQSEIKIARSAAASQAGGGSGPNIGAQLEILDRIQGFTNPQGLGEPTPFDIFASRNPTQALTGRQATDTFAEWMSNSNNYNSIPSVRRGDRPSAADIVSTFLTQTGQSVPAARQWARNSEIYNLLVGLANTAE